MAECVFCNEQDIHEGLLDKTSGVNSLLSWQTMSEAEKGKNKQWVEETVEKLRRNY